MTKEDVINNIIKAEGGYTNNPNDTGGETNHGITIAVARANGYQGNMIDLPIELAKKIYIDKYWNAISADNMPISISSELVDTAVNMGVKRAGLFLQRALNVLNDKQRLYSDVKVDGDIGPATIRALDAYLNKRAAKALLKALECLQGAFYIEIAEKREKNETFVYGWLSNRVWVG